MASFKVLFCLSLHVLFLVSSSGTRLFHPFSIADPVLKMESKSQYNANTHDEEITYRHFESKQFSGIDQLALAVADKQHPEAAIIESKRALIEEGREAIKASIERNGGIPYETKRRSPGGPDPHHH
ncbi:hypothetical protein ERO13_A01G058200v2 [Gossypium hirsutum]|uniref:Uncharacterized protein n=3 Tax=Gossypium TaxID=3633 RepID=A0A2P5REQ1_GOSBA|nr:hypothetical protein ES319_A01G057800v1 [Gossypium barbadense]KAG4213455.1 hypothetical protein ERO13_A01G058200v2 [Gossypium hirsutum]TYH30050.1 hypothetical protein ES288_A01G062900v1 [Gossypium darwinii]TYI42036.1 hypothetical protein ES332_A01G070300v1 [Gossypium tomentosum]PPD85263.1 hypothetical protein GOBAR_DD17813 [Gossypium barbadense]